MIMENQIQRCSTEMGHGHRERRHTILRPDRHCGWWHDKSAKHPSYQSSLRSSKAQACTREHLRSPSSLKRNE
ncbi:hypothetical protein M3J09_011794 [Ascochyta lentis]